MQKTILFSSVLALSGAVFAQDPASFGPAPQRAAAPPAKTAAPFDPTGYWVSLVTEDWRFRMITPGKGDYPGVPLTDAGKKLATEWDPAKDEAAGEQCKNYGAAAIMRVPGRLRITWQDDNTLKVEADAGTQTRILNFKPGAAPATPSSQGYSAASWDLLAAGGFGPHKPGSLKIVTKSLRAGYLRKNGVPYSANAAVTEYWDVMNDPNSSETWLLVKTLVEDPTYLTEPFITSTHFRKQPNADGFAPSACSAR